MSNLPSYRRTASGYARVTINGHDFSLGKYGTAASKARYDQIIAEFLASGRSKSFGTPKSPLTLAELMVEYHEHCVQYYKSGPNSEALRIKPVLRVVKGLYAAIAVDEFGPDQFFAVREALINSPKELSRRYINAQMKHIKRMFRWAAEKQYISWPEFYRLKEIRCLQRSRTQARELPAVEPVDESVVKMTLQFCSPILRDMIQVQLLTAMRPHEICGLSPGMINEYEDCWKANIEHHKTAWRGRPRQVLIGPKAQAILKEYMARDSNSPFFSPAESEKARRAELSQRRVRENIRYRSGGSSNKSANTQKPGRKPGIAYTPASYRRAIAYACAKAGIDKWSPNQLRHTAATKIRSQFGLDTTAAVLGHKKVDVTQVYAEVDLKKAMAVVRKIG